MINLTIFFILFFLDLYLKKYVSKNLKWNIKKTFFNNFLQIIYVENRGIAFNLLENKIIFIAFSNMILLSYVVYLYFTMIDFKVPLILIFCGGIGNLFDRLKRGYVVDYIYFNIKKWPVFNLSDFYIIFGVILFLI